MDNAFVKSAEEVCQYFGVDENVGLSDDQVKRNTEKYGPNGKFCECASILSLCTVLFYVTHIQGLNGRYLWLAYLDTEANFVGRMDVARSWCGRGPSWKGKHGAVQSLYRK